MEISQKAASQKKTQTNLFLRIGWEPRPVLKGVLIFVRRYKDHLKTLGLQVLLVPLGQLRCEAPAWWTPMSAEVQGHSFLSNHRLTSTLRGKKRKRTGEEQPRSSSWLLRVQSTSSSASNLLVWEESLSVVAWPRLNPTQNGH